MDGFLRQYRPRSNSFAGFKRKYTAGNIPRDIKKQPGSPVLSRKTQNPAVVKRMFSFNKAQRLPKIPRPSRTSIIFDCLKKGLREYVKARQKDLDDMRSQQQGTMKSVKSRTGFHYDLDKQIKNTERFIRKLEFHLTKIEELQDNYNIQQRIREGAKNIMRAYEDSSTHNYKLPVHEAKIEFKDCTQAMCCMEAELATLLGYFHLEVKGITGYARLCVGDHFEVVLRHGAQKWKFRGKVEKDNEQTWENKNMLLYPLIADNISIKVTELKGLGRPNIIVGNMECDTNVLYKPEQQDLTVDINDAGTLKLNMKIVWSPFQLEDDSGISYSSTGSMSKNSLKSLHHKERSGIDGILSKVQPSKLCNSPTTTSSNSSSDGNHVSRPSLHTAIHNVKCVIHEHRGIYPQVQKLDEQIKKLEELIMRIANGISLEALHETYMCQEMANYEINQLDNLRQPIVKNESIRCSNNTSENITPVTLVNQDDNQPIRSVNHCKVENKDPGVMIIEDVNAYETDTNSAVESALQSFDFLDALEDNIESEIIENNVNDFMEDELIGDDIAARNNANECPARTESLIDANKCSTLEKDFTNADVIARNIVNENSNIDVIESEVITENITREDLAEEEVEVKTPVDKCEENGMESDVKTESSAVENCCIDDDVKNLVVECVEDVTESEAITENNMIKDDLTEQEVKAKNHECEEETTGSDTITKENITVEKDLTEVEVVLKKTSDECVECITGSDTRTSENNIMENEPIDEKVELKKAADECVTVSDAITRENNITENYPTDEGAELKKHADECVSVSDAITTENNIMENDTTDEGAELKKHADECVSVSDAITTENNIVENDTTDEEVKLKKHSNECGEFVTGSAITENNVVKDENTVGCNIVEDDITDEAEFNLSNINIEHTQCFTKDTDFSEKHLMTENMTVKDGGEVCTVIANKIDNEMTQHQSIDESIHTSVNCDNYRVEEKMMEGDISIDAGICMSTGSSPIPPSSPVSTGNQALDTTFTQHLLHCQYLLSMLGSYGPLKAKETMALTKIEKQTRIFQRLLQINPTDTIASVEQVVPELNEKPAFIEFWLRCCEEPTILYGGVDSIMVQLELKFGAKLRTTHPTIADNVFQSLIKQMLDRQAIDINSSNSLVTLYQFTNWCLAKNRPDIEHYVNDLISELTLNETLKHGNEDMLSVIRQLPKTPLPASNLYALAMLLLNADSTTKAATSIYMEMMATDNNWKRQALNVYLEYLEENDKVLRQAGCLALASMNATSCIDHLLYICRCDVDDVKQCARDALLSFGEEGKKAYESTISSQYDVQSMALLPNITSMHHQMTTEL